MAMKQLLLVLCIVVLCGCEAIPPPVRVEGSTPAPTEEAKYSIIVNGNEYLCNNYDWGDLDSTVIILKDCRGYLGQDIVIKGVTSFSVEELGTVE
jgi:hypothetical protein